jgi:hypothetical protein
LDSDTFLSIILSVAKGTEQEPTSRAEATKPQRVFLPG